MIQHYDALGQPIQVGDQVIISKTGTNFLGRAEVVKLTPKNVTISYIRYGCPATSSKDPKTMVVINKQHEYALETWPELYI